MMSTHSSSRQNLPGLTPHRKPGAAMRLWLAGIVLSAVVSGCARDEIVIVAGSSPQQAHYLTDFSPAQTCSTCHPQQYREWAGSMHRYSANDPIWMLANNALQSATNGRLQAFCFQCHSPVSYVTQQTPPTFQFSDLPDLGREGVTCDFCHVLKSPFTTTDQHVGYTLSPGTTKYGTLSSPVATASHLNGFEPAYDRSEVCRNCHDLIINGVPTEMTFTEWQQSPWGTMGYSCQECHMQRYTGRAAVDGPIRENLHRHDFTGGVDVAMTDFPDKDIQRAAVDSTLKNSVTMSLTVPRSAAAGDSVRMSVLVYNNQTAHNIPTSVFFFRQMWIEMTVWRGRDTAYRSGYLDANGDLMDTHSSLNPGADSGLALFGGILYKHGVETNVFELDSLVNESIPPYGSRNVAYTCRIPAAGTWNARARLLFRPFGPYLFRSLGAHALIPQIPTYEMSSQEVLINVR